MSDLLRKKNPKRIEKGVTVTPKTTFTMDELPKPPGDTPPAPKPAAQTTSIRVSVATKDRLNAMITMGLADTVDQMTDMMLGEYIANILTKDQKKQLDFIYDLYAKKNKKK